MEMAVECINSGAHIYAQLVLVPISDTYMSVSSYLIPYQEVCWCQAIAPGGRIHCPTPCAEAAAGGDNSDCYPLSP